MLFNSGIDEQQQTCKVANLFLQLLLSVRTTANPHAPLRQITPGTKQECPPSPSRSAVRSGRLDKPAVSSCGFCARPSPRLPAKLPPSALRGKIRLVTGLSPNASNVTGTIHAGCRSTIVQPSEAQEPAGVRSAGMVSQFPLPAAGCSALLSAPYGPRIQARKTPY